MVSFILTQLVFGLVLVVVGLGTGWLLHGRITHRVESEDGESRLAREMLSDLRGLASKMASDVTQHQSCVNDVDSQLQAEDASEIVTVKELVATLVDANRRVRQKLTVAESQLADLTEQMELNASEARTDGLTGTANRRAFDEECVRRAAEYQQTDNEFALLMIDIDKFKGVNDRYGHISGDVVLRGVARVLMDSTRGRDMVARYGGEEFAVLMPTTSIEEAKLAAEEVRNAVAQTRFQLDEQQIEVTISVGVAEILPYEEMASLIRRADQAVYGAKHAGRNAVFWHDGTLAHPLRLPGATRSRVANGNGNGNRDARHRDSKPDSRRREQTSMQVVACKTKPNGDSHIVDAAALDPELLKNMGNKTIYCQAVRNRIAEFVRGGPTFSTLLLTIDDYDQLSRKYGDGTAKLAVDSVAMAIDDALRDMDLISRYDAATFGIVLPKASLRNAIHLSERLRKAVSRCELQSNGQSIPFTISVGIVEVADGDEMATLVERAASQLGLARAAGGNRCGFAGSTSAEHKK